jgi:predicted amidophosphoribosyltransferase
LEGSRLTARFLKIDDHNRGDHHHLTADDECYFLYEYTSGQNYQFSATNSLISNLKKKPSLAATPQYKYKQQAIRICGIAFGEAINPPWLARATLVPVPPSKARSDPEYDDRILQICRSIPTHGFAADIRELVIQTKSLPAAHEGQRPTVAELLDVYQIDEAQAKMPIQRIGIIDDVLTAGTHFCAMKSILQQRLPGTTLVGFFIARRVFSNAFDVD